MFRIILKKSRSIWLCSVAPVAATTTSENTANKTDSDKNRAEDVVLVETGWDRVLEIFKPTQYENISPEIRWLTVLSSSAFFTGCGVGCFIFSRHTYLEFMRKGHASQFASHLDAKALLTNNMMASMAYGAFMWGSRTTIIAFTWLFLHKLIHAYRGERGWQEHVGSGVVAGTLVGHFFRDLKKLGVDEVFPSKRFIGGPRSVACGMLAGGLIGGMIGATNVFNKTKSMPELNDRYWQKYWKAHEEERRRKDPNYKPDN